MDNAIWLTGGAILGLLVCSFFFSGTETALTGASRARIHQKVQSGSKRAKIVEELTADKERMIGAILLGNNVVNILSASLATSMLIALFGEAGVAYATVGMTAIIVVFTEVLPKTWAIARPEPFALAVAPIARVVFRTLGPITWAVQKIVGAFLTLFGVDTRQTGLTGHEELRGTVDLLHKEGTVVREDRDMLGGVLDLRELEISDVMVHRTRMLTLDADLPAPELIAAILESPYTRVPLYRGTPDNIVGIVHVKDILRAVLKAGGDLAGVDAAGVAFKPWFVPDTTSAQAQLNAFLKRKLHVAMVVDEYGEVQGLVTLEDILEEIVGEIADEHDTVIDGLARQPDGSYLVEGALPIRDLNRALDWTLPDEEATTVAGLVIHEAKLIPDAGQKFTFHGRRFEIVRKAHNRIVQLRITPLAENAEPMNQDGARAP